MLNAVLRLSGLRLPRKRNDYRDSDYQLQQTPFSVNRCHGFRLANKTYALSSVITNGVVQTDPNNPTKNLSVVTAPVRSRRWIPAVLGAGDTLGQSMEVGEQLSRPLRLLAQRGVALNLTSKLRISRSAVISSLGIILTPRSS